MSQRAIPRDAVRGRKAGSIMVTPVPGRTPTSVAPANRLASRLDGRSALLQPAQFCS